MHGQSCPGYGMRLAVAVSGTNGPLPGAPPCRCLPLRQFPGVGMVIFIHIIKEFGGRPVATSRRYSLQRERGTQGSSFVVPALPAGQEYVAVCLRLPVR